MLCLLVVLLCLLVVLLCLLVVLLCLLVILLCLLVVLLCLLVVLFCLGGYFQVMQNTYKAGDKVFIHVDALAKVGVDVDLYAGYVDEEYFSGTVLSLHAGRTWNVEMEFGETVRIASKNFFKEAGSEGRAGRRISPSQLANLSCGAQDQAANSASWASQTCRVR